MRQYELAIRIAQVHHLVDERKYKKALAVIQTLDVRQVRALSDLRVFAEVYTKTEQYDAAKATYLRIYRRSHTKRVLYRLIYLSIRTNALNDAEAYYQEFVRMNPNVRDALILRYRIDKASGAPIGQLIDILQELKQEEYIEEWAYELAKLYHRAGRMEECREECQDILLWFGTGEIVERAKILIEHLEEKDSALYFDDRDFTVPKKEEPNPEDTGSLPDLDEYIEERKGQRREERREVRSDERPQEEEISRADRAEGQNFSHISRGDKTEQEKSKKSIFSADEFVDDYEDDDFAGEGIDISQKAKDGIQKLSGLLKLGKKEEDEVSDSVSRQEKPEQREKRNVPEKSTGEDEIKIGFVPHSQSGMGITQDLAKEISAIYEMEHREQLREKAVTVIQDSSNIATNVVERMTQAVQKNIGKSYIPLDIEEIQPGERRYISDSEASEGDIQETPQEDVMLEDTQEVYVEEASEGDSQEMPQEDMTPEDTQEVYVEEASEEDSQETPQEDMTPEDTQEVYVEEASEEDSQETLQETDISSETEEGSIQPPEEHFYETISEEEMRERALTKMLEEEVAEIQKGLRGEDIIETTRRDTETLKNLIEEDITDPEPEHFATEDTLVSPEIKSVEPNIHSVEENVSLQEEENIPLQEEESIPLQEEESIPPQEEESISLQEEENIPPQEEESIPPQEEESIPPQEEESVPSLGEEEEFLSEEASVAQEEEYLQETAEDLSQEQEQVQEQVSGLDGYQAPDIPVVETAYMEMPEITYDELPTTRALQQSFQNVLKLIAGELDPSHFVLMGDGPERIVGVSKQIVRVMKETGYLSQGRIAKIHARQINKMDLISFRNQLKGNCLLIEEASDLLFPTITRLFSIMEEYAGDFVVILVDEGTTLDQLFRFVPALAKKFKYIIDISNYTEEDYMS